MITRRVILVFVVSLVMCGGTFHAMAQKEAQAHSNSCIDNITQDIKKKYESFDEERVIKSAQNHSALKSQISANQFKIGSISQTWENNPVRCTATLKNVLVQYVADDLGKKKIMTISVDPKSYESLGIDVQVDTPRHDSGTSTSWGGYSIKGAPTEASSFVYRTTMNWSIPTPNDPPQIDCGTTSWQRCFASAWTGLSKTEDGTSDMAQVGTDSICIGTNCESGRQYRGWIETFPGTRISDCMGNTYSAGDSMYGEVVNQKKDGGDVTKYDFYLIDTTQNHTCSSLSQTFGSTDPHYGTYMTERPNFGGTLAHLADFGTMDMYGIIYYDGASKTIRTAYSSGTSWYKQWIINNGVSNELVSGIDSANNFSITWITSQGT